MPCFLNLVKVSESPTVGTVLRVAIGGLKAVLAGIVILPGLEGRESKLSCGFFCNCKKQVAFRAVAITRVPAKEGVCWTGSFR